MQGNLAAQHSHRWRIDDEVQHPQRTSNLSRRDVLTLGVPPGAAVSPGAGPVRPAALDVSVATGR